MIRDLRQRGVQVIQQGDTLRVVFSSDRLFQPQSATIRPSQYRSLAILASLLNSYSSPQPATVAGFTDNIGTKNHQQDRSAEQAQNVAAFLWAQNVPSSHLVITAYGQQKAVSSNKTVNGSAANRRVEVRLPYRPDKA